MSNLDEMLARIGGAPLPSRLATMDEAVFAGLAEHQRSSARNSLRSLSIAADSRRGRCMVGTGEGDGDCS